MYIRLGPACKDFCLNKHVTKGLFTPGKSEKDQRISKNIKENFRFLLNSLSLGVNWS